MTYSVKKYNVRDRESSFELLRLLCMFLIVIHHFFVHGLNIKGAYGDPATVVFFDTGLMCRIDVFILISGYFGISFKLTGAYKYYSQLFFYGCIGYLIHVINGASIGKSLVLNSVFVIGASPGWWFAQYYFFLYLLSPLLNVAIKAMNKAQFGFVLILMTILNLYYSFVWRIPINSSGCGLFQFVYLYLLGRYIHILFDDKQLNFKLGVVTTLFVVFCLLMGWVGLIEMNKGVTLNSIFVYKVYNHPFVLLSGIFLFLAFVKVKFQSKWINWIASSTFAIYLIHENVYLSRIIYGYVPVLISYGSTTFYKAILLMGGALVLMMCCVLVDKVRLIAMGPLDRIVLGKLKPLDERLSKWLNKSMD